MSFKIIIHPMYGWKKLIVCCENCDVILVIPMIKEYYDDINVLNLKEITENIKELYIKKVLQELYIGEKKNGKI